MDEPSNWFTKLETEGTLSNYNHRLTNPLQSPTINNLLYKTPHIHNYVYYRPTNEWTITWTQLSMNQYMQMNNIGPIDRDIRKFAAHITEAFKDNECNNDNDSISILSDDCKI
ncbi:hypothetical protein RhiirA4_457630 [Rhizophagus irregularis]|uniref:Uncharacterized protein n=1 Tax=Rhizophagus irregularis TaxID=588596 RepID=A0A2I1GAF4_9GLOM|nr:hypothetical protein RhiirA4_457630 [Rhizophagus irregularis]